MKINKFFKPMLALAAIAIASTSMNAAAWEKQTQFEAGKLSLDGATSNYLGMGVNGTTSVYSINGISVKVGPEIEAGYIVGGDADSGSSNMFAGLNVLNTISFEKYNVDAHFILGYSGYTINSMDFDGFTYGAELEYNITDKYSISANYKVADTDMGDIERIGASFSLNF